VHIHNSIVNKIFRNIDRYFASQEISCFGSNLSQNYTTDSHLEPDESSQ